MGASAAATAWCSTCCGSSARLPEPSSPSWRTCTVRLCSTTGDSASARSSPRSSWKRCRMRLTVDKHRRTRPGWLTAVTLLLAVALATQGCAMLRRRAEERPPYRKVTPPIAYEMIRDTPGILIVDLRPTPAFHGDTGHIYRAFNIPEDRL